jgi:uncharacterized protein
MTNYKKPLPRITAANAPFWRAAKAHELRLPRCRPCRAWVYPIGPMCQQCWSEDLEWDALSGRGRVSSWVVFRRAFDPAFAPEIPYVVAQIDLAEGIRFISNIVGAAADELSAGMPVKAVFDDVTDDIALVKFAPHEA